MPQPPTISIPTTSTSTTSPPHTTYAVTLTTPLRTSTQQKRYSDFTALHTALTAQTGSPPPASLPPKTWLKSTVSSPALAESRRASLESYLRAIDTSQDPRWRTTPAWRTFLGLPDTRPNPTPSTPNAAAGHTITTATPSEAADPTIWLDTARDAKAHIRTARAALARRTAAQSATAAHDAAADAKRASLAATSLLATLEAGLAAGRAALGEGEARRRRDALAALRRDVDGLAAGVASARAQVATAAAAAADADADASSADGAGRAASSAARDGVLRGPTGRRVLGGGSAAAETERTRALDNGEVLGLQATMLAEQDAEVDVLGGAVRRMREMGAAIGEELDAQAGMLELLDADVERVQGKVDVGRRRVGKIK